MGDATDMEHDTEEGPGGNATVREEGPGGDAIDTKEEPGVQGVNSHTRRYKDDTPSTLVPTSVPKTSPAST